MTGPTFIVGAGGTSEKGSVGEICKGELTFLSELGLGRYSAGRGLKEESRPGKGVEEW